MIDKSKPYGEVIAEQQAEHGKRVEARKRINGQPMGTKDVDLSKAIAGVLDTAFDMKAA